MAKIQVKVLRTGYYEHGRRKEGAVFFMDEKFMKKDSNGKFVLPSWVEAVDKKKVKAVDVAKENDPALDPDSDEVI